MILGGFSWCGRLVRNTIVDNARTEFSEDCILRNYSTHPLMCEWVQNRSWMMEEPIYVFWDIGDNKGNVLSNCKIRCCGSLIECNLLCNWACAYVTLTKSMWTAQVVRDDLKLALCVHRLHMENEAQFRQYWLFRNTNSCYKSIIERNLNASPEDCNKLHACPSPRFSTYLMNLLNGRPKHFDVE